MNKVFARLIEARGLTPSFLAPRYEDAIDPFVLYDMKTAVSRICQALKERERILIYGDYDVDGVTASIVMEQTLKLAGARPEDITVMLPDRFIDGYGMSQRLITQAKKHGATLIITVDCGSRNHDIIKKLKKQHIDTIVTDHHETEAKMPDCSATINPHRKDHPTPELQNLAGVGVAFKLAQALVAKNLIPNGQEKWLLDLVLIGTICDNMLLTGENRILGHFGIKVLEKTRRPGLKELIRRAGIKKITSDSIGFQIGPRLNAAGRLSSADLSLNLLRAKSAVSAAPLAEQLETLNLQRKSEQRAALSEIKERGVGSGPIIVEAGSWHEGILGIIAGRLVEEYHKPAFVFSKIDSGIMKGSGRSFGDFNLSEALTNVADTIISGGGHAAAAGVKLEQKSLPNFRDAINAYYESLHLTEQEIYFRPHADLDLTDFAELDLNLLDGLRSLEPFGAGNAEPIFRLKNVQITDVTRMGAERNHLRLDLRDAEGRHLKCITFYAPESWFTLDPDYDHPDLLVTLTDNDWNGVRSPEARICDIIRV